MPEQAARADAAARFTPRARRSSSTCGRWAWRGPRAAACGGRGAVSARAARKAANRSGTPVLLNTRTDVSVRAATKRHGDAAVDAGLERARVYAVAGADGLFVPGSVDERLIGRSPLPVNVRVAGGSPTLARPAALCDAQASVGPRILSAHHADGARGTQALA